MNCKFDIYRNFPIYIFLKMYCIKLFIVFSLNLIYVIRYNFIIYKQSDYYFFMFCFLKKKNITLLLPLFFCLLVSGFFCFCFFVSLAFFFFLNICKFTSLILWRCCFLMKTIMAIHFLLSLSLAASHNFLLQYVHYDFFLVTFVFFTTIYLFCLRYFQGIYMHYSYSHQENRTTI